MRPDQDDKLTSKPNDFYGFVFTYIGQQREGQPSFSIGHRLTTDATSCARPQIDAP